jgi:hypothetical protein
MPQIDDTVTARNLHERAEQVAVPDFDWLNQPITAIVDGLLHTHPECRSCFPAVHRPVERSDTDRDDESA